MRIWAAALLTLALASAAQADCADLRAAFAILDPTGFQPDGSGECTPQEWAMFRANGAAIDQARAPEDPAALYGTWLGDDVYLYVTGVMIAGQEVLVIRPGLSDGQLHVTQYWYTYSTVSDSDGWADGEYPGLVADIYLTPGTGGAYEVELFGGLPGDPEPITYGTASLGWERSEDLRIKSDLNYFEREVSFRLADDVLVVDAERLEPLLRDTKPVVRTFTRIEDGVPDLALKLTVLYEISFAQNFDCLSHQLSGGPGPFLASAGVADAREIKELAAKALEINARRAAAMTLAKAGDEAARDTWLAATDEMLAFMKEPLPMRLEEVLRDPARSGCAVP